MINPSTDKAPADDGPWTIGRLLTWTADYLSQHDSPSPRLDAEVLLAYALGCQRIDLYTAFHEDPGDEVRTAFREMVRRRAQAMPVAYLVGHKEFYSLDFRVTPDVLIPRPETELLVLSCLDKAKGSDSDGRSLAIADVGTGSGILAICVAKHLRDASVTAIDVSPQAIDVANINAINHGVNDRVTFLESDLLAKVPPEAKFDFILSNPPYVSETEFEDLADDVRKYEPALALTAGPHGTEVIERLTPQAAEHLQPGGYLMLEISPMIAEDVRSLVRKDERFGEPEVIRDNARHERAVIARRDG